MVQQTEFAGLHTRTALNAGSDHAGRFLGSVLSHTVRRFTRGHSRTAVAPKKESSDKKTSAYGGPLGRLNIPRRYYYYEENWCKRITAYCIAGGTIRPYGRRSTRVCRTNRSNCF